MAKLKATSRYLIEGTEESKEEPSLGRDLNRGPSE